MHITKWVMIMNLIANLIFAIGFRVFAEGGHTKGDFFTDALNCSLQKIAFNDSILENTDLIKARDEQKKLQAAPTPNIFVTGTVTNAENKPIARVSVVLKSDKIGTTTDGDGHFFINVPANSILQFTCVGYMMKEVTVKNAGNINVNLELQSSFLNDVVVIGYGESGKRLNTGSITRISGDAISDLPVQSFEATLNGRSTGVNMIANSGVVNQAPVFRIRGTNSLSLSSYPLIVIDGIAVFTDDINVGGNASNNPLASINPADIESIDIAKDASATSIYGSRAANGVVFITTKKGKPGKGKLVYDAFVSWSKAVRLASILDADQYLEIKNEGLKNAGTYNATTNYYGTSIGSDGNIVRTNWYDYIFRTGVSQNHTLSLSGANEATRYYLSAGYSDQNGILKGNDYNRKSVTYNLEHKVSSWLSVGSKTNYTNDVTRAILSTGNGLGNSTSTSVAYRLALVSAPIIGPYNKDGSYNSTGLSLGVMDNQGHLTSTTKMGYTNPVITLNYNDDNTSNNVIQSNLYVQVNPVSWVTLKTMYGIDNIYSRTERYFDPRTTEGASANGMAVGVSAKRENSVWTNTATLEKNFGDHSFNLLLGHEEQRIKGDQFGLNRSYQSDPYYSNIQGGFGNVAIFTTANQVYNQYLFSLFSRLQYNFKTRYLFSANLRQDESSVLGKNNKKGVFWAFSGGWEITKEKFWASAGLDRLFSSFKIRASYGKVGNISGIGNFGSLSTYSANLYGGLPGLYYSAAGNANLQWETSKKTDIGFSFGVLKDRLTGEIAYYKNNIDGLILAVPVPASAGLPGSTLNSVLANVGTMYNKGWEVALNGTPLLWKNFSWQTALNISFNQNKVTSLAPTAGSIILDGLSGSTDLVSISLPGYPVGMIYAIRTAGVDPSSGRRIFLNAEGNKVLYQQVPPPGGSQWEYEDGTTANAVTTTEDGVVYKKPNPGIYGGFINSVHYKNFDLDILFTYQFSGCMYYGTQGTLMDQRFPNNSTKILERWQKPGDITDVPRLQEGDFTSWGYSLPITANVYSSNYIRLKNLALSYCLPACLIKKMQISSLKLYAGGQNLFISTKYPGADPEVTTTGNGTATQGFDRNMTPNARIITVGIRVSF